MFHEFVEIGVDEFLAKYVAVLLERVLHEAVEPGGGGVAAARAPFLQVDVDRDLASSRELGKKVDCQSAQGHAFSRARIADDQEQTRAAVAANGGQKVRHARRQISAAGHLDFSIEL